MSDYHTTVQYQLRIPEYLRDQIKESAKDSNRSMNADIVARLENSFMSDDADQYISNLRRIADNLKVYDLGDGVKRVVHGEMLGAFDVDYTADLDSVAQRLQDIIDIIKASNELSSQLGVTGKSVTAKRGGHHIDIIEDGVGSLNWLSVENIPTSISSLNSY